MSTSWSCATTYPQSLTANPTALHNSPQNRHTQHMFRSLSSQLAAGATAADSKKVLSPSLRPDIYSVVDQAKIWITAQAGDGVSYGAILAMIQKHLPETKKPGLEAFGQAEGEIAVIVGGITNMILELSKWEGMSAGMAMRTWVDSLVEAHSKTSSGTRKVAIAKGATRGLNQFTDASLLTKDFTTRIQIISCLKTGELILEFLAYNSCTWSPRLCKGLTEVLRSVWNRNPSVALSISRTPSTKIYFLLQLAQGFMALEPTKQGKVKLCGVRSSFER